jgi:hypothetical protein
VFWWRLPENLAVRRRSLDFLAFPGIIMHGMFRLFTFGAMPKVNAQPASGDLKQKRK